MQISPSVLAADFTNLKKELKRVETADFIHLDIMDGHFVPNISFGPDIVKQLRGVSDVKFDLHLMISHPLKYIDKFVSAGVDIICFHIECEDDTKEVIEAIKKAGKLPALAVKPGTPVEAVYPYIEDLFMVLVMTVEPGFGGQSFMEDQMEKVREIKSKYPQMLVEVDGGINRSTIETCSKAGVDIVVAGTGVFGAENAEEEISYLRQF